MKKLKQQIQRAIIGKCIVEFFYTSKTSKKSELRRIELFLFGVNFKGNYYFSGYNLIDPTGDPEEDQKNYDLDRINPKSFKILKEKYTKLRVNPNKLYRTKKEETTIICVADFPELIAQYYNK